MIPTFIASFLQNIHLPMTSSHKGQNGKLLIIGGSELFHAASKWSLDVASHFVDMVFYSSIPSNNKLIQEAKGNFWNGIVIPRDELEKYIEEADCILIGPGMERTEETEQLTNTLLKKYSAKKWVLDAGALQMIQPQLLKSNHIITPHSREMKIVEDKLTDQQIIQAVILLKGQVDVVRGDGVEIKIEGGNVGMTKGGTGDVLAGLVAALYCTHDALTACVVGSYINKKTGDFLYESVGPYFNTSDLATAIPQVLWQTLRDSLSNS
ncbi:MAG: NAD(P)H-hydrate dehydratase [Candidatus Pacebacteria bacterium RIFOXYB1_FULL_39_46]|nr:MAG: NAD(P)H-hydrate dehydratase [Candidatus Pacebacteria bacterium RIFOXYA1_FULL_38_18]OGJ38073.1 MAG: NAD(P)H-hydrate dehydratase [Candidatus Pacebacteria bacterium RIFOXYB1_FULL_39_46]OGJ39704.1 MAG: NAD(P)H-hydrate dehydratase [Candidatus Pacebacteria bacterium RIFOXYC1_FULL_39_21]OGJ39825.1 MAG: NAD(P)H-hydrate dehydratase [Candidatus Pacebacteria bacterium RIFOXYD1_FULL_39_27]